MTLRRCGCVDSGFRQEDERFGNGFLEVGDEENIFKEIISYLVSAGRNTEVLPAKAF